MPYTIKHRARKAVHYAVSRGVLPHVTSLECFDCGKPAEQWDHPRGYDSDSQLDVEPVCQSCHNKRDIGKRKAALFRANHRRVCFLCFRAFTLTNDSRMGQVVCSQACCGRVKTVFRTQSRTRAGERRRK